MSTNPKDLKAKDASEELIAKHKRNIDGSVRTLMREMEHENTLVPEPPISRLQRVLKIYRQIKPLLALLGSLPFIPYNWRSPLLMFTQALDALAAVGPDLTAQFKAGKDL